MAKIKKRIIELDKIFKRIYEDDITGAISHERFLKLSAEYEIEQRELQKQANDFQKETADFDRQQTDFNQFRQIVRKYVGITELTPTIVNEFVKKIIVHAPINQADTGYRKYRLFLISLVNLSHRTSLFPIKRNFRRNISNPADLLPY